MSGHYRMHRGWMDHPVFTPGPFSQREAWLWLIEEASWRLETVNRNGVPVTLDEGQLAHSIRFMASAWGWHRSAVDRFLGKLARNAMIRRGQKTETPAETATETAFTVITICNYKKYQRSAKETETPTAQAPRQDRDRTETNLIPFKKVNKGEEESGSLKRSLVGSMLAIYAAECPGFVQPKGGILDPDDKRARQMVARLNEDLGGDLEEWRAFCKRCAGNRFINGTKPTARDPEGWKGGRSLDWIANATNFRKIVEGHYAADEARGPAPRALPSPEVAEQQARAIALIHASIRQGRQSA